MLRRTPSTLLVCLVFCLSTFLINNAAAADPEEALEILLKPNDASSTSVPQRVKAKPRATYRPKRYARRVTAPFPAPPLLRRITKVKVPPRLCGWAFWPPPCILPQPRTKQWDMSLQVIFARVRGNIAYPRYDQFNTGGWGGEENKVDLNDDLGVPGHDVLVEFTAHYQFRPNWGLRYSILPFELNGGGWPSRQFSFGRSTSGQGWINENEAIQTKWEHQYHRFGLVYDAVKSCSSVVRVFADWVHTDDKIQLGCTYCGTYQDQNIFSQGGDSAMAGLEFERCIQTAINGGTLSYDIKGGVIFLDDVEGWDVETGLRYSIRLGCGRTGYFRGGYRFIQLSKSQPDLLFSPTVEGGFLEFGFIF